MLATINLVDTNIRPKGTPGIRFKYIDEPWAYRQRPRIHAGVIEIPLFPPTELVFLDRDRQRFLVIHDHPTSCSARLWFGGLDGGRPFLARVDDPLLFLTTCRFGGAWFLRQLKPPEISLIEKHYRVRATRQGDMFAVPVDVKSVSGDWAKPKWRKVKDAPVLGANHRLTGEVAEPGRGWIHIMPTTPSAGVFARGALTAPNHPTLIMTRPHLLVRAAHIASN